MDGSELLVAQLKAEGVDTVFGIPGIHLMHVLDALYHEPSIRFVTTRHEQATTYLADGYSRVTGRPGVAMVVPGNPVKLSKVPELEDEPSPCLGAHTDEVLTELAGTSPDELAGLRADGVIA